MPNPDLSEIVADFLRSNGYGGLFRDSTCACSLDDLMPCDYPSPYCEAGYRFECGKCADQPECENGRDYDSVIGSSRGTCPIKEAEDD